MHKVYITTEKYKKDYPKEWKKHRASGMYTFEIELARGKTKKQAIQKVRDIPRYESVLETQAECEARMASEKKKESARLKRLKRKKKHKLDVNKDTHKSGVDLTVLSKLVEARLARDKQAKENGKKKKRI